MTRYRIFDSNGVIATLADSPGFDVKFTGKDPNKPIGGMITIDGKKYPIVNYHEFHGLGSSENEFHELDQNWYAHVFVEYT